MTEATGSPVTEPARGSIATTPVPPGIMKCFEEFTKCETNSDGKLVWAGQGKTAADFGGLPPHLWSTHPNWEKLSRSSAAHEQNAPEVVRTSVAASKAELGDSAKKSHSPALILVTAEKSVKQPDSDLPWWVGKTSEDFGGLPPHLWPTHSSWVESEPAGTTISSEQKSGSANTTDNVHREKQDAKHDTTPTREIKKPASPQLSRNLKNPRIAHEGLEPSPLPRERSTHREQTIQTPKHDLEKEVEKNRPWLTGSPSSGTSEESNFVEKVRYAIMRESQLAKLNSGNNGSSTKNEEKPFIDSFLTPERGRRRFQNNDSPPRSPDGDIQLTAEELEAINKAYDPNKTMGQMFDVLRNKPGPCTAWAKKNVLALCEFHKRRFRSATPPHLRGPRPPSPPVGPPKEMSPRTLGILVKHFAPGRTLAELTEALDNDDPTAIRWVERIVKSLETIQSWGE